MAAIERLTITLPAEMAELVKGAVNDGDYASSSEVIREALRDWKMKRELRLAQLAESLELLRGTSLRIVRHRLSLPRWAPIQSGVAASILWRSPFPSLSGFARNLL
jgi:putative addiction module CopG family antidote